MFWFAAVPTAVAADEEHSITTNARTLEPPDSPTGAVSTLDTSEIEAAGGDLSDALSRAVGAHVVRQSNHGQPAFAQIRGGNPRQTAAFFEGFRLSIPAGAGFDLGSFSPAGIDSIDVYRGASAVHLGGGALSGALDLSTRLRRTEGAAVSALIRAGAFGSIGAAANGEYGGEDEAGRVALSWSRADGDFAFVDAENTTHERRNNQRETLGGLFAHQRHVGGGTLRVASFADTSDGGAAGPSEFQNSFRDATTDRSRGMLVARWSKHDVLPGVLPADVEVGAGAQGRVQAYRNPSPYLGTDAFESTSRFGSVGVHTLTRLALGTDNLASARLEVREERYTSATPSNELSTGRTYLAGSLYDEHMALAGKIDVHGGARAEAVIDEERQDVALLPSLGVGLGPWYGVGLKANVGRTFRVPDFDELYLETETVRGDESLRPEDALTWDLGASLSGHDNLGGSLTYFDRRTDNPIQFLPVTAYQVQALNLPASRAQGLEAAVVVRWSERLRSEAQYTLTRARTSEGRALPNQPLHAGSFWQALELGGLVPLPGLRVAAGVSARSPVALDLFGQLEDPAAISVRARARATIWPGVRLQITGYNLLDDKDSQDALQRPLPGRELHLSLRISSELL